MFLENTFFTMRFYTLKTIKVRYSFGLLHFIKSFCKSISKYLSQFSHLDSNLCINELQLISQKLQYNKIYNLFLKNIAFSNVESSNHYIEDQSIYKYVHFCFENKKNSKI